MEDDEYPVEDDVPYLSTGEDNNSLPPDDNEGDYAEDEYGERFNMKDE